jgi:hypothetical protein
MAISLTRGYMGRVAGSVAAFAKTVEDTLIASGQAVASTDANLTTGAYTQNTTSGKAAIAAGSASVVITNVMIDVGSKVMAVVAQATADTTLLRVERIVVAAGSFTIFGTANATATTVIDWCILEEAGAGGTG